MKAFEFTTNRSGKVMLQEVPITKIVPDLDPDFRDKRPQEVIAAAAVAHPVYSPMANRQAPHIGSYRGEDVRLLESKPGSPYVFYLNISKVIRNGEPLNGVTKENMYRAWQSVADQFSMLDLNVTTNVNVYTAAKAANILRTGVINFVNRDGRSYAPLHSFGTTSAGTLFRNPSAGFDYGYGIGMTGAHEVGHQMGVNHDRGTPDLNQRTDFEAGVKQDKDCSDFGDGLQRCARVNPPKRIRPDEHAGKNLAQHRRKLETLEDFANDFGCDKNGEQFEQQGVGFVHGWVESIEGCGRARQGGNAAIGNWQFAFSA